MDHAQSHGFGAFKPVGHVVACFATQEQAVKGLRALAEIGLGQGAVQYLSDRDMLARVEHDNDDASAAPGADQAAAISRGQRDLARLGYHWLVVRAKNDGRAAQIADCLRPQGAERAQHYSSFAIDELIEPRDATAPSVWARAQAAKPGGTTGHEGC
jgi:hypothetical protein